MITEKLEEQAALYAAGALSAGEREQFEMLIDFHPEVRRLTGSFLEAANASLFAPDAGAPMPPPGLKARVFGMLSAQAPKDSEIGFVLAGPDGLIQWVNPTFTEMCGYQIDEVHGRRLGPILQGEKTDRDAAARMRTAVHQGLPCLESLVNYHKGGEPYHVSIEMTPMRDAAGELLWFAAREHKLAEPAEV